MGPCTPSLIDHHGERHSLHQIVSMANHHKKEYDSNNVHLCHRSKSLLIVNSISLSVSLGN